MKMKHTKILNDHHEREVVRWRERREIEKVIGERMKRERNRDKLKNGIIIKYSLYYSFGLYRLSVVGIQYFCWS